MIKSNLETILQDWGWTQTDLMRKAGIAAGSVNRYCKSENIGFRVLDRICMALDLQPGDILQYVPDEEAAMK